MKVQEQKGNDEKGACVAAVHRFWRRLRTPITLALDRCARTRLLGLVLLLGGVLATALSWGMARGGFLSKLGGLGPMFCVFGLALLIFPERYWAPDDRLAWVIGVTALVASAGNFFLLLALAW